MRRIRLALGFGLAGLLLSPVAALAQLDPDRLNGVFEFQDGEQFSNNKLVFELNGQTLGVSGEVSANVGPSAIVTIRYRTEYPDSMSAGSAKASIGQGRQVTVELEVVENLVTTYSGEGSPNNCRVDSKITGTGPNNSQATLKCDLGSDLNALRDGMNEPPSQADLVLVEQAFQGRKDVKIVTRGGKLQIRHKGVPVPVS